MALRELSLVVDAEQGLLKASFLSQLQGNLPRFPFGDSIPLSVRLCRPTLGNPSQPWQEIDLTGQSVRAAIGIPAGKPSAGTFTLSYGGDTTGPLAFNATAVAIQTALNALASIIAAGHVTVEATATNLFQVNFTAAGVRTDIASDTAALYPPTGSLIVRSQTGTDELPEVLLIRFEAQAAAYVELADDLPAAAITVETLRAGSGTVGKIQTLALDPIPYDGAYALTVGAASTAAIAFDAEASDLQIYLESLSTVGAGKVKVTGNSPLFTVTFDVSLGNTPAITADVTALIVPTGRAGSLNLKTAGIISLLNGSATAAATFEIEVFDADSSTSWTVLQMPCQVIEDLIPGDPIIPPSIPSVDAYIAARAVCYDRAQALSGASQSQVQGNIGLAPFLLPAIVSAVATDGPLAVQSIPTVGLPLGTVRMFNLGLDYGPPNGLAIYQLESDYGDSTSVPFVRLIPADYDSGTNRKVWDLVGGALDAGTGQPFITQGNQPFYDGSGALRANRFVAQDPSTTLTTTMWVGGFYSSDIDNSTTINMPGEGLNVGASFNMPTGSMGDKALGSGSLPVGANSVGLHAPVVQYMGTDADTAARSMLIVDSAVAASIEMDSAETTAGEGTIVRVVNRDLVYSLQLSSSVYGFLPDLRTYDTVEAGCIIEYMLTGAGWQRLTTGAVNDRSLPNFMRGINSLQGDPDISLQTVPTVNLPLGAVRTFSINDGIFNGIATYRLFYDETGPTEDTPLYVSPNDFNSGSNAKGWLLIAGSLLNPDGSSLLKQGNQPVYDQYGNLLAENFKAIDPVAGSSSFLSPSGLEFASFDSTLITLFCQFNTGINPLWAIPGGTSTFSSGNISMTGNPAGLHAPPMGLLQGGATVPALNTVLVVDGSPANIAELDNENTVYTGTIVRVVTIPGASALVTASVYGISNWPDGVAVAESMVAEFIFSYDLSTWFLLSLQTLPLP